MTNRKLTIFGIIILLSCVTIFAQSSTPSKFKVFVYSGITFPSYPSSGFASFFRPGPNIGAGLNYQLSPKLSLTFDYNHYGFKPTSKHGWEMDWTGYGPIFIETMFSNDIIDVDYDRNDLLLELKYKPFNSQKIGALFHKIRCCVGIIISEISNSMSGGDSWRY